MLRFGGMAVNFLAPWFVPVIAAAATVPPLLLLYFLKLRRREVPVASTLLWKQAITDLQANAPFQRLRNNLLLILQLLILLLAALALAEPITGESTVIEESVVLLIDHSASMGTREKDGRTRLQLAREEALDLIDRLSPVGRAMVIAFADRAAVLCPFTTDKGRLRRAVEAVTASHAAGRIAEAMQLAEAHATPVGENVFTRENEAPRSRFVVLTDGRLPDADEAIGRTGRLDVVIIGQETGNTGIVGLDIRRHHDRPERVSILARVRNFSSTAAGGDLSLFIDGALRDVRSIGPLSPLDSDRPLEQITLPAMPAEGSEAAVVFDVVLPTAAAVELRLAPADALDIDNRAFGIVPPPRAIHVLLVTAGNRYLRNLIMAMPLAGAEVWTPEQYENAPADRLLDAGRCRYDVVILDGHSTERLPPGNYLFFGGLPLIEGFRAGERVENQVFLDWDAAHPVLRHVAVDAISAFSWRRLLLPSEARTLIESTAGPVLALVPQQRRTFLIWAFGFFDERREMLNTGWVFDESLVVFMHNALNYLGGGSGETRPAFLRPGEAIVASVRPGLDRVSIRRPDQTDEQITVRADGLVHYGRTDQVGLYRIDSDTADRRVWAVSLNDEQESFIAPYTRFQAGGGEVRQGRLTAARHRPLWPFLLLATGGVLLLEWFIYNRRVWR